jgi:hypothetical protein
MVPDLQSAEGGVPQVQVLALLQLSEVSSLVQYDGQQTLSTNSQEPHAEAAAEG